MTRARILADYVSSGDELALKAPLANPTFTGKVTTPSIVLTPSSAPGSPAEGELYYDSTNDIMKTYDGSTFKGLTSEGVAGLTAQGGTITDYTTGGVDYRVHTFYTSGILIFYATTNCDIFMVGGGGGGGQRMAGGGGAGAYFYTTAMNTTYSVKAGTYNISIGAGGTPGTASANSAGQGGSTMAFGVVATGGAGGKGRFGPTPTVLNPANGGGGASYAESNSNDQPSTGTSLTVPTGWTYKGGNDGGTGHDTSNKQGGGGGGGANAGADGGNANSSSGDGGAGGAGSDDCTWVTPEALARPLTANTPVDSPYEFCGGGGGFCWTNACGAGGIGGGGGGSTVYGTVGARGGDSISEDLPDDDAEAGRTQSTGGRGARYSGSGGGAGTHSGSGADGGAGGSGILILRYVRS